MKQFQIIYKNDKSFHRALKRINQWCNTNPSYTTLFRIYSTDMNLEHIQHVCDILDEQMPDALYLGCTSHANLINGALTQNQIILSCTIFEYESTQVEVLQLPFSEKNVKRTVDKLKEYCNANSWIKAVEMHATMLGMSVKGFCDEISTLRDDIQVFGGGAYNPNMDETTTVVFSKGKGFLAYGIIFLLFGGDDFYIYSTLISGWKPLSRKFTVTKSHREILHELDGKPAFNVYERFLNISRNDKLITNTLEFPLFMDYNGMDVLRCPLGANDDGSLLMATEVTEGSTVRLSYGDPETILNSIRQEGQNIANFQPEVIQAFSCAARRAFWGDENISDETILLNNVAPTFGFYTVGEFLRINGEIRNFNITLILAAMREGEPKDCEIVNMYDARLDNIENERIPLIRRFVSFIDATTSELEETNKKLAQSSITDGLTGLYNRAEIERGIKSSLELQESGKLSLIMLDLDNFKKVNDTYGHKEGDNVIIALSDVLRNVLSDVHTAYIGRWGGEEFMVLLQNIDINKATELSEKIRLEFASISYESAGCQTVSIGVTQAEANETSDTLCTRVDKALYTAKANGKNQVVKL